MIPRRTRWLVNLLLLSSGCLCAASVGAGIPSFEASYRIERSVFDIGQVQLRFERGPGDAYVYHSLTEVAGFIAWFRDDRVEETSRGVMDAAGIRPAYYRYRRTGGDGDKHAEITFDWQSGSVENVVEGKPWKMAVPPGTLDKLSVQIAMMRELQETLEDRHFKVADGGRLKDYRILVRGRETIELPAGVFRTVKVEKDPQNRNRRTFLWVAPALGYLPVQIMRIEEDGAEYYSVLEHVSDSLRSGHPDTPDRDQ
jgi:hypothetical protein